MNLYSFRHILRSLYGVPAYIVMLVLSACNLVAEPDQTCHDSDDITVSFRVYTGKTSLARAEDFYGNSAENYIDLTNFKIMIFDEDQKLKQMLYDNGSLADNTKLSQLGPGFYYITTKLDKNRYSRASKFAIVALANWQQTQDSRLTVDFKGHALDQTETGALTIADLKEMTLTVNPDVAEGTSQPASWVPTDESGIPMFGSSFTSLAAYDSDIYSEGHPMPVPDVNLVRALTKIEIINRDLGGPVIKDISLVHRNQNGYLVQDYDFNGQTANVSVPTIPVDNGYTQRALPFSHDEVTHTYTAYIPEMLLEPGMRQAIRLTIDMNGEESAKWIYLAPYVDGQPLIQTNYDFDWTNIKRNYYYQYVINSLAFEFLIDVKPWVFGGKVHIDSDDIEEIPD